jgi:hypothetical protein
MSASETPKMTCGLPADPSHCDQKGDNPQRHLNEGRNMKPGIIFGVVLVIIIGAIIASHQMTESGNKHFDKAGENWKQN